MAKARVTDNLIGTEVRKSLGGGAQDLVLRWREAGTHWRRIQAETLRIAARICEASESARWCVEPDIGCGVIGRGLLATSIRLELADGTDAEMAAAEAVLRQVIAGLKA